MTRLCGCSGAPRSPHLDDAERASRGLRPCPMRGRTSGPSGPSLPTSQRGPTSAGNRQIRLPEVLRVAIVEAERRGVAWERMAEVVRGLA
jgi:hypothetical protein